MSWEEYLSSEAWKCKKSETGAHFWVEKCLGSGEFVCKHCKEKKRFEADHFLFPKNGNGKRSVRLKATVPLTKAEALKSIKLPVVGERVTG